ncbi:MAG: glycoside hydrolase family 127 protein [Clostridia bacterium]|nr:glycoside hydrolase family 127 protein [Clostridia bacterium]
MTRRIVSIPLHSVKITDPFWTHMQRLIHDVVLPFQWEALNGRVEDDAPGCALQNFRIAAGLQEGRRQGVVFLDSDVYKWLEAAAYSLAIQPNAELLTKTEEAIELIGLSQQADGYINTYYTLVEPDMRFRNLTDGHELYCAGHLFEAAAAYFEATGRRAILDIASRFADYLVRYFLDDPAHAGAYPGHPEVEAALIRLYHATDNEAYLRLSAAFINARGCGRSQREAELEKEGFVKHWGDMLFKELPECYMQAHAPVREQHAALGHAVRAMYLYSAMADMAYMTDEAALREACEALFHNTVFKRMYVTGGIGSAAGGECFTSDDDLPNDTAYAETCASVGLMMFAERMWRIDKDASRYDVWETALYNTVLACLGSDGKHFFYTNPLSINPCHVRESTSLRHIETTRREWFGVACCPPNAARRLLSLGRSLYACDDDSLYLLSHIDNELTLPDGKVSLRHDGDHYTLHVNAPATLIMLRVPAGYEIDAAPHALSEGYVRIQHPGGLALYPYRLTAKVRILRARPEVAHTSGKLCVAYGQTVYCLEEADNGKKLAALALPANASFRILTKDWLPPSMRALETKGVRYSAEGRDGPYTTEPYAAIPVTLTFIPYSQWNNRGEGEMCVWVNEAASL